MRGSIKVDFAGTFEEAREYAKANGLSTGLRLRSSGNEGLPELCYQFRNKEEYRRGLKLLISLGWDAVEVRRYNA